jgi:group I intron endonuclease
MEQNIGEVYCITNTVTGKKYIGQAMKTVGKINAPWGTHGRWLSHVREAKNTIIKGSKDHCVLLNHAIRKYGEDKFDVSTLCQCSSIEDLDVKESLYIKEYQTKVPNGYNLTDGGAKGKDSDETRQKKREMRLGKVHEDDTKKKISLTQLGNRRTTKKYPEDANLPKFIAAIRRHEKIIGYCIRNFPKGQDCTEYINKSFSSSKKTEKEWFDEALECLKLLTEQYPDVDTTYNVKLPVTRVDTVERDMRKNKNGHEKYDMPKYIILRSPNDNTREVGFSISGLRIILDDGSVKRYERKFTSSMYTMEEKLAQAIAHLEEIKKTKTCLIDEHVNAPEKPKKKIVHLKKLNSEIAHNSRLPDPMEEQ